MSFNVTSKTETQVETSLGISNPSDSCMAAYPNNERDDVFYFITTDHSNPNGFYKYNVTASTTTQGPTLNGSRFVPACITHGEYLYVVGSSYKFERINLIDYENDPNNTDWEIIDSFNYDNVTCDDGSNFYITNAYLYLVNWKNYIFLVGNGWSGYGDNIGILDVSIGKLYCSQGSFSTLTSSTSHMCASIGGKFGDQRLYTFGGFSPDIDEIYYTNNLSDFSFAPTNMPSFNPTIIPTRLPSYDPTVEPTNNPTIVPTSPPSMLPTNNPTNVPTFVNYDYNFTALLDVIIDTDVVTVSDLNSSAILQKDLITAMKDASVEVRYDLKKRKHVNVELLRIYNNYNYSSGQDTGRRRRRRRMADENDSVAIGLSFEISTESSNEMWKWSIDVDSVLVEFRRHLMQFWDVKNSNNSNSTTFDVQLSNLVLIDQDDTTIIETTGSSTTEEPNLPETTENASKQNNGGNIGSLSLDQLSYITLACILIGAFIVTVTGTIDAKFFRHNELFRYSTMVIVTMYLMDVVSGLCQ